MRTTIDINESLLLEAERLTSIHKKKALIEKAFEELIRQEKLMRLASMLGKKPLQLSLRSLNRMRKDA